MNNFLKSIYNSYLYKSVTKALSGVNLVPFPEHRILTIKSSVVFLESLMVQFLSY
ncbi:hypothetical protein [Lysinibacillus xylanilyticus]|uniref:Uncharacterized protein n=1 Tax=Lysinibacillus xylanilyticus TaxID=582475 RepID=A0ABT4EWB1_9BACI|nr:hypothetical protein [Lysinibacillus xylanilyticus]MCY9549967.1 hypothetical protein [Lysinibacillus xylanilyticus]